MSGVQLTKSPLLPPPSLPCPSARRSGLDSAGVRRATFLLPPSGARPASAPAGAAGAAGPPLGGLASLPTATATAAGVRRRAGSGSARSHTSDTERQSTAAFSRVYTFRHSMDFNEDTIVRHMEPPLAGHLELKRLANFKIRQVSCRDAWVLRRCHVNPCGCSWLWHGMCVCVNVCVKYHACVSAGGPT